MESFRVIIAGCRDFNNYELLREKCDHMLSKKKDTHKVIIVSGHAAGADALGEVYALERGFDLETYPADWSRGRMAGTFGYELNPALLSEEEKQTIREQIQTYKKYERLINEGTYWRLSNPFEDEVSAWMSVSREQDRALVSVVRLVSEANPATVYIRLRGLKPDAVYLEENSGKQYFGAALMAAGIPLPAFTHEYEAYQFSFVELKEAKKLFDKVQQLHASGDERVVISIYGGSGSGKTTIATALQQYFLSEGIGCYLLGGDNYPHRIPKRNDEERLRVYEEAGEEGLREYLGTPKEIDFDCINQVLAEFHAGKDTITLRHMGREDGDISSEETDFAGIPVMLQI